MKNTWLWIFVALAGGAWYLRSAERKKREEAEKAVVAQLKGSATMQKLAKSVIRGWYQTGYVPSTLHVTQIYDLIMPASAGSWVAPSAMWDAIGKQLSAEPFPQAGTYPTTPSSSLSDYYNSWRNA